MFTGPNGLKSNKWHLHRHNQTQNVEGSVTGKQPIWEPAHQQQNKHMQWYQVDNKYIASPGWYLKYFCNFDVV